MPGIAAARRRSSVSSQSSGTPGGRTTTTYATTRPETRLIRRANSLTLACVQGQCGWANNTSVARSLEGVRRLWLGQRCKGWVASPGVVLYRSRMAKPDVTAVAQPKSSAGRTTRVRRVECVIKDRVLADGGAREMPDSNAQNWARMSYKPCTVERELAANCATARLEPVESSLLAGHVSQVRTRTTLQAGTPAARVTGCSRIEIEGGEAAPSEGRLTTLSSLWKGCFFLT